MTILTARTDTTLPWWVVMVEGVAALIIGLLLLAAPGMTVSALIQIMGLFWLVGGLFRIVSMIVERRLWGWKLFGGILGILAGIAILERTLWSSVAVPAALVILLGVGGILIGMVSLVMAVRGGGWGIGLLGILSIFFGLTLLLNPLIGAAALPFVLGGFALVGGIATIILALRLR